MRAGNFKKRCLTLFLTKGDANKVLYPKLLPPWYQNIDLMAEGLFNVREASTFLRIGRSKLYELMASQDIPFVKLGKCLRIPKVVLKIYAERG